MHSRTKGTAAAVTTLIKPVARRMTFGSRIWILAAVMAIVLTLCSTVVAQSTTSSGTTSSGATTPSASSNGNSTNSATATASSSITATATPSPTPLPAGTRQILDSQIVQDTIPQGQQQTYHISLKTGASQLPVRRQLEQILVLRKEGQSQARNLNKRQQASSTSAPTSTSSQPAVQATPLPDGNLPVYISVSTCTTPISTANPGAICPALTVYISTSASIPIPGPGMDPNLVQVAMSFNGLVQFSTEASQDVYFTIAAPALTPASDWTGSWTVQVGASSQDYVQKYQPRQGLVLDDTDNSRASFLTTNFTTGVVPTLSLYLIPLDKLPLGLLRSMCAIKAVPASLLSSSTVVISNTNRTTNLDSPPGTGLLANAIHVSGSSGPSGPDLSVRQQVIMSALTNGTNYTTWLVTNAPTQSGAQVIYQGTNFRTKRHDNCVLLTNLQYCQSVAYAVPVTPGTIGSTASGGTLNTTTLSAIGAAYDGYAKNLSDSFDTVMGQFDCSTVKYSLVRNCTDCVLAYHQWLCAVSIPKCTDIEDVTDPLNTGDELSEGKSGKPELAVHPELIMGLNGPVVVSRNTDDSRGAINPLSPPPEDGEAPPPVTPRNPLLNPGDYGEVLPCADLCFNVVQSCPTFLGFNCPIQNMAGNYAHQRNVQLGKIQCNGLGLMAPPIPSLAEKSCLWSTKSVVLRLVAMAMAILIAGVY